MNQEIKLGIVASGGGTDASAIMSAWKFGSVSNISRIILFGTKSGAGCFDKALILSVPSVLVECANKDQVPDFNRRLGEEIKEYGVGMLFLAGCVWEIDTRVISCPVFNIHPANTWEHGGRHMYGLAVHKHVLAQIKDWLHRQIRRKEEIFFTQICVHQVDSSAPVDGGKVFLALDVPIPKGIITQLTYDVNMETLAKDLQKWVLKYEHLVLPGAVNILAQMCLEEQNLKP